MKKQQCIDHCNRCHSLCESLVNHCLSMGGEHAKPNHIRLLRDCSEICQTTANFKLRDSPLHHLTCGACAEVCRQCAMECETLGVNDVSMAECARACRICSDTCQEMFRALTR